jgi:hypothetical protein
MAWIESHQTLREHPKVYVLVDALGVSKAQVLGHLHLLWWWCVDYALDGVISQNDVAIARAAEWTGEPKKFVEALVGAEFLDRADGVLTIHDWLEYCGTLVAKRLERQSQRKTAPARKPKISERAPTEPNRTKPNQKKDQPPDKPPAGPMPEVQEPKPNGTTPPGDGSSTPKSSEYPPPKTDVQKVVMAFKLSMGVPKDDRDWDGVYFRRYSRAAGDLLTLFRKDVGRVADCIEAVSGALTRKGLSWTPETIVKHASDWKEGKLFK